MKQLYVTIENGKMIPYIDAESLCAEKIAIPYDIDTLTVGQAQNIYKALEGDEDYVKFLSGLCDEEVWSPRLLEYARKAMRAMAIVGGFDESAVEALSDEEVIEYAPRWEMEVLRPLYQYGVYVPKAFEGFDFEGVHYNMPLSVADGFGGVMPMADTTAEEWAESNDLRIASTHPVEYMHLILAILCRPEGESYNERVARERAEKFKGLPCSVALDVFFCRFARMSIMLGLMGECLAQLQAEEESKAKEEVIAPSECGNSACITPAPITTEA